MNVNTNTRTRACTLTTVRPDHEQTPTTEEVLAFESHVSVGSVSLNIHFIVLVYTKHVFERLYPQLGVNGSAVASVIFIMLITHTRLAQCNRSGHCAHWRLVGNEA